MFPGDGNGIFLPAINSAPRVGAWLQALPEEAILLAFDRAGAFPSQLAQLRDERFEFVTYDRRPYAQLPSSAFTETVVVGAERFRLFETRKNRMRSANTVGVT